MKPISNPNPNPNPSLNPSSEAVDSVNSVGQVKQGTVLAGKTSVDSPSTSISNRVVKDKKEDIDVLVNKILSLCDSIKMLKLEKEEEHSAKLPKKKAKKEKKAKSKTKEDDAIAAQEKVVPFNLAQDLLSGHIDYSTLKERQGKSLKDGGEARAEECLQKSFARLTDEFLSNNSACKEDVLQTVRDTIEFKTAEVKKLGSEYEAFEIDQLLALAVVGEKTRVNAKKAKKEGKDTKEEKDITSEKTKKRKKNEGHNLSDSIAEKRKEVIESMLAIVENSNQSHAAVNFVKQFRDDLAKYEAHRQTKRVMDTRYQPQVQVPVYP